MPQCTCHKEKALITISNEARRKEVPLECHPMRGAFEPEGNDPDRFAHFVFGPMPALVGASQLFRCPKSFLLPNEYEIAYVVNMVAPLYATAGRRPEFSNAEVSP
jgi:hypothetical protein